MTVSTGADFFEQRREWSRWKHEILRRYLPKFAGILGSRHSTIYYVDGFAGAGTYGGNPPVPGSPLMAAQHAANLEAAGRWRFRLRCINVEPRYFAELREATASFGYSIVQNLRGTFRDQLAEILRLTGSYPTLFFLDPFGYKGMEWDVITQLAQRAHRAKTELIINFNVGKVDRDAGWLDSYGQPAAPSFVQLLNDLFGVDSWQAIVDSGHSKAERDEWLTELYADRLGEAFHGTTIRYPVRTITGQLKYYLLHVTSHPRGTREMSDVLYRVGRDYEAERERRETSMPRTLPMFPEHQSPATEEVDADLVSRLAEDIYQLGSIRRQISFRALQDALSIRWLDRAIGSHYRKACRHLMDRGKIQHERRIDENTVLRFL